MGVGETAQQPPPLIVDGGDVGIDDGAKLCDAGLMEAFVLAEFPKAFLYACRSFHGRTLLSGGLIAAAYLDYITLSAIVEISDFI